MPALPQLDETKLKKDIHVIMEQMPVIWEAIVKSRVCPHILGLAETCRLIHGSPQDCMDCWKEAVVLPNTPLWNNEKKAYVCTCGRQLTLKQITDISQCWICPSCKKEYTVPVSSSQKE